MIYIISSLSDYIPINCGWSSNFFRTGISDPELPEMMIEVQQNQSSPLFP